MLVSGEPLLSAVSRQPPGCRAPCHREPRWGKAELEEMEPLHGPGDERVNPDCDGSEQGGAGAKLSFRKITRTPGVGGEATGGVPGGSVTRGGRG